MKLHWNDLPPSVQSVLSNGIDKNADLFLPQSVNMIYNGLGKMNCRYYQKLPFTTQSTLLTVIESAIPQYTSIELSNIVYSLGKIGIQWEKLPYSLNENLSENIVKYSPHHISTGIYYLFTG
jgi:hypothetical protein